MSDAGAARRVRGEIVLPADSPARAARIVVQVEDITRADAPSVVIAEQRLDDVPLGEANELPFAIDLPAQLIDPRAMYSVRAHVDTTGSGTVERGDLITTQTYPVLTRGAADEVRVEVRRV